MKSQPILALILAVALVVQPAALAAQSDPGFEGASKWRRWALAGAGALVLGGVATFTDQAGDQARTGVCDQTACVVVIGSLLGAGLGFLLGSELDNRADRTAREGPTIDVDMGSVDVLEGATGLVPSRRGVFALGREGVDLVDDNLARSTVVQGFQPRAGALALNEELLILATNARVLGVRVPDPLGEPVELLASGAASLATLQDGQLTVGEPGRIRRMEVQGSPASPSLMEAGTVATTGLPAAIALGAGGAALWTLEDSVLVARNPTTLAQVGSLSLPGRGVAISLSGPLALVSMGNEGVLMVDVSDPGAPSGGMSMTGMEFAYDAVALDGRLYVAAGAQGIFVYDTAGGTPTRIGVIRDTDFAGDLLVRDGHLYILDRAANKLHRM